MEELIDEYLALNLENKKRAIQMKELKARLLAAWDARSPEDEERNTFRGFTGSITVTVTARNTFDKKKYEARFGSIHKAYFKSSSSTSLRVS